jgi:predicted nucleic acid-binding protein
MAHRVLLLDTGPLYALLDRRDQHHAWAKEVLPSLEGPFLTCDAVLSETYYLLGDAAVPRRLLGTLLQKSAIKSNFHSGSMISRILELIETYREVPMSFADACLVCMMEQNPDAILLTVDYDFTIYRQHRRRVIPLIAPFST